MNTHQAIQAFYHIHQEWSVSDVSNSASSSGQEQGSDQEFPPQCADNCFLKPLHPSELATHQKILPPKKGITICNEIQIQGPILKMF